MARHKNVTWNLSDSPGTDGAMLAALMDIRDELQRLNALLHCPHFQDVPHKLDRLVVNTKKRKYRRRKP